uniref:Uncharacterized protein n=1 Tax=Anopheles culicifacies TaxID=139723 RepID=A0A182LRB7_9DIPT
MEHQPASLTGSVFPVRPSLDHLLAMGDDDEEEEEEEEVGEIKEKPELVQAAKDDTAGGVVTDHCSPVVEQTSDQATNGEVDDDDDDDGASELTELQQLPDTQQPAGTAKEQSKSDVFSSRKLFYTACGFCFVDGSLVSIAPDGTRADMTLLDGE